MLSRSSELNEELPEDELPELPDTDPLEEPEEPDEPAAPELDGDELDGDELDGDDDDEPALPDGDVELLLPPAPDVLLPAVPVEESELDEPPAAIAAPDTAERAKAKSTALFTNFM